MNLDLPTLEKLALNLINTNDVSFTAEAPMEPYGVYTVSSPDGTRLITVQYDGFRNKFIDARSRRNCRLGVVTIAPDMPDCQYVISSCDDIELSQIVNRIIEACIYRAATCNRMARVIHFLESNIR